MTKKFEPLLSAKIFSLKSPEQTEKNLSLLRWPKDVSIKYDGIRLVEYQGQMHTRSLKVVRNLHVRDVMADFIARAADRNVSGMDGEITVGPLTHPNLIDNTKSGVMSGSGTPEFEFQLFDSYQHPEREFTRRTEEMRNLHAALSREFPFLRWVEQKRARDRQEFLAMETKIVSDGHEGIMGRAPDGVYKFGRSTLLDGILSALKRFVDDECVVVGILEEVENTNPLEENELGRSKRSSHQENLVPKGRMGTFVCVSPSFDKPFKVGGGHGLTHAKRQEIWDNREKYLHQPLTYMFQEIGVKEKPRLPRYKAFRDWDDLPQEKARALRRVLTLYLRHGKDFAVAEAE